MSQDRPLRDWKEGDRFSAGHLQEAVVMLRPLSHIGGGGITQVTQTPDGTAIYTPEQQQVVTSQIPVLLRLTSNASGGGKYNALIVSLYDVDIPATGDLTSAEAGLGGEQVLALNAAEEGKSTHDLTAGGTTYLPQLFIGVLRRVNADGTKVYTIPAFQLKDCVVP